MSEPSISHPLIRALGEDSVLVEFEAEVNLEINRKARRLAYGLEQTHLPGLKMAIPAYRSVIVYFDPFITTAKQIIRTVETISSDLTRMEEPSVRLFKLPTVYGGKYGPDLDRVADVSGLTPAEVIETCASIRLPVYFLGFICSQAYLGGVPEMIWVPRHDSPRPLVAGGSFGIAGPQANILAVDSPSGLNYLGRTFVRVFDPSAFPPTAFRAGDQVQCSAVSESEAVEAGKKAMEEFIESL
jgi:KipI family sensor histidine kinase inhibitor